MQQLEMKNNSNKAQSIRTETCPKCDKTFNHERFVDHLFSSKECMRIYWEEEEKTHSVRMRHKKKFGVS
jgi:hypothetical protein